MEKKHRMIIAGSAVGVLLILALYLNFCSGGASVDAKTQKAADSVREKMETEEQAQPKVNIPPPPPEAKSKSGFQRR